MTAFYTVRVTWWTREGWVRQDFRTEGSRPSVAIKRGMDAAEARGAIRSTIAGAVAIEGPPGFKGWSG